MIITILYRKINLGNKGSPVAQAYISPRSTSREAFLRSSVPSFGVVLHGVGVTDGPISCRAARKCF